MFWIGKRNKFDKASADLQNELKYQLEQLQKATEQSERIIELALSDAERIKMLERRVDNLYKRVEQQAKKIEQLETMLKEML